MAFMAKMYDVIRIDHFLGLVKYYSIPAEDGNAVNGKYLKSKTIKIKFNKKTYKVKTNKKGVATWKVKSSMLKKLKVGKKYSYKVTYGKDVVTKKLTIKK